MASSSTDEECEEETIRRSLRKKLKNSAYLNDSDSEECNGGSKHQDLAPEDLKQTPSRCSERLREKRQKSFSLPKREDVLEEINYEKASTSTKKRGNAANDFVKGCSRYVTERVDTFLTSDESGLSDFIDDGDEGEDEGKSRKSKKTTKKKSSKKKLYASSDSECGTQVEKSRKSSARKRKNVIQSDDSDLDERKNGDRAKNKLKSKNPVISDDEGSISGSSQDDDEVGVSPWKKKKRQPQEELLDSDVEMSPEKNTRDLPMREKSERKQREEEALAKMVAKRKQKAEPGTKMEEAGTPAELVGVTERPYTDLEDIYDIVLINYDKALEAGEDSLTNTEFEENEYDREFVDDNDYGDVPYESTTSENLDSCANVIHVSPKIISNNFHRISVDQDSDDSDLEIFSCPGISELFEHIKDNNIDKVRTEIESNQNIVSAFNSKRQTLLHQAVIHGSCEITQLLVDSGCDKLALDSYSLPPPAYAILYGRAECLRIILEDKQDIDLALVSRLLEDNLKMSILHFAVYGKFAVPDMKWQDVDRFCLVHSLEMLFELDDVLCCTLMRRKNARGFCPLVAAIVAGQSECVEFLLSKGADVTNKTKTGGNLLHFCIECNASQEDEKAANCLRALLTSPALKNNINGTDDTGLTPLMYSAQHGIPEYLQVLLECGASVHVTDTEGTTSLHLAAASGSTDCVKLLLEYGHKLDCLDSFGWPPLLYANFSAQESCVLALMEPNPRQIFVLGDLLRRGKSEEAMKRNCKVVKDVLVALANQDVYYRVFNDFIRTNPELLDQNDEGLLRDTWRGILDFNNKKAWFKRKLYARRKNDWSGRHISLSVVRDDIFQSAMNQLDHKTGRILRCSSVSVTFRNEPGICAGPKREFFVNVCKDILDEKHKLFYPADDNQCSLLPNAFFRNMTIEDGPSLYKGQWLCNDGKVDARTGKQTKKETSTVFVERLNRTVQDHIETRNEDLVISDHMDEDDLAIAALDLSTLPEVGSLVDDATRIGSDVSISEELKSKFSSYIDEQLKSRLERLKFLGKFIGLAICQEHFINLHLSKPLVKQILGIKLDHSNDLGFMDYQVHKNLVSYILESDNVDDLLLPTSLDVLNPWNDRLTTVKLFPKEAGQEDLTEKNKHEYVELVSKYRLKFLIDKELDSLCSGLYQVIPKELVSLFTADEFSLLINGVGKIDVNDWQKHTQYNHGSSEKSNEIQWFWEIVRDLKEDEKALLLKFCTGTPCVPVGGFAELQGLNGKTMFQVSIISETNKIPTAATCFNWLKLTNYSSKKDLKDKLLIAIRHGTEGFSFS